jgi:hypothetical protein
MAQLLEIAIKDKEDEEKKTFKAHECNFANGIYAEIMPVLSTNSIKCLNHHNPKLRIFAESALRMRYGCIIENWCIPKINGN